MSRHADDRRPSFRRGIEPHGEHEDEHSTRDARHRGGYSPSRKRSRSPGWERHGRYERSASRSRSQSPTDAYGVRGERGGDRYDRSRSSSSSPHSHRRRRRPSNDDSPPSPRAPRGTRRPPRQPSSSSYQDLDDDWRTASPFRGGDANTRSPPPSYHDVDSPRSGDVGSPRSHGRRSGRDHDNDAPRGGGGGYYRRRDRSLSPEASFGGRGRGRGRGRNAQSRTLLVRNVCDSVPNESPLDSSGKAVRSEDIRDFFRAFGGVRDVRLPLERASSCPRGYAFVEFEWVDDAERAVHAARRQPDGLVFGGRTLSVEYSFNDHAGAGGGGNEGDWTCAGCSYVNFARRAVCNSCGVGRDELDNDAWRGEAGGARRPHRPRRGRDEDRGGAADPPTREQKMRRRGYELDRSSGWFYDPRTQYYVVDIDDELFYDGTSGRYLKYDKQLRLYVPAEMSADHRASLNSHHSVSSSLQPAPAAAGGGGGEEQRGKQGAVAKTDGPAAAAASAAAAAAESTAPFTAEASASSPASSALPAAVPAGPVMFAMKKSKPAKAGAKVVSDLQRWNQRQKELKEELKEEEVVTAEATASAPPSRISSTNATPVSVVPPAKVESAAKAGNAEADAAHGSAGDDGAERASWLKAEGDKVICELCRRGFKSAEVAEKHEKLSELHRANLEEHHKQAANAKEGLYRDRAAERRKIHPPDEEQLKILQQQQNRGVFRAPPKAPAAMQPAASSEAAPPPPAENVGVGNQLLKAMGWTSGQGLGRDSEGISAPIETRVSTGRAGLGSSQSVVEASGSSAEGGRERVNSITKQRWKNMFDDEEDEDHANNAGKG